MGNDNSKTTPNNGVQYNRNINTKAAYIAPVQITGKIQTTRQGVTNNGIPYQRTQILDIGNQNKDEDDYYKLFNDYDCIGDKTDSILRGDMLIQNNDPANINTDILFKKFANNSKLNDFTDNIDDFNFNTMSATSAFDVNDLDTNMQNFDGLNRDMQDFYDVSKKRGIHADTSDLINDLKQITSNNANMIKGGCACNLQNGNSLYGGKSHNYDDDDDYELKNTEEQNKYIMNKIDKIQKTKGGANDVEELDADDIYYNEDNQDNQDNDNDRRREENDEVFDNDDEVEYDEDDYVEDRLRENVYNA